MTVRELKDELDRMPEDAQVQVEADADFWMIKSVTLKTGATDWVTIFCKWE